MKPLLWVGLLTVIPTAAVCAAQQNCKVGLAISSVVMQTSTANAQVAQIERSGLDEMNKILDTIPATKRDSAKPLGQMLSPMNAGRFGELSEKLKVQRLSQLFSSDLSRDANFVGGLWRAAKASYVGPSKMSQDDDLAGKALFLMREWFPNPQTNNARDISICSVDTALFLETKLAMLRLDSASKKQDEANKIVNEMRSKYGQTVGSLDPRKMDVSDVSELLRLKATIFEPIVKESLYIWDLDNIRAWYDTAEMVYAIHRDELATYGADADRINQAYKAKIELLPDRGKRLESLWEMIDKAIPSDTTKDIQLFQAQPTHGGHP